MEQRKYQKIHIVGGAGSGKTTLAKRITEKLGYPGYDLDQIGWSKNGKIPLSSRLEGVEQILAQPQWVTEGIYLWWTEKLFEQADLIVWLDLPYRLAAWRIIKRHVQASLKGDNPHAGLRNLISFVTGVRQHYHRVAPIIPQGPDDDFAITRSAIVQELEKYPGKVVCCQTTKEIGQLQTMLLTASSNSSK